MRLPTLVQQYLDRALPSGRDVPRQVRVGQVGEMWFKPGGRASRFTAVEEFAVEEVAFAWRARFPIVPLVWLRLIDRYTAGEGLLEARLFGFVPLMRQTGHELSVGEVYRYLAELPWVPHAMLSNRQLEWTELDVQTVEVATQVGPTRVAVRLQFDAAGDIVGSFAEGRSYREGKRTAPRPWGGAFSEYAVLGGIRVPTRAEVRWDLPGGPFTYWRGTITSIELLQGASQSRA